MAGTIGLLDMTRRMFLLAVGAKFWNAHDLSVLMAGVGFTYGLFMIFVRPLTDAPGYNFLDPLSDSTVGWAIAALGCIQLLVAVFWSRPWPLRAMGFMSMWHWSAFTCGIHLSDPTARGVILTAGYAAGNMLILFKA